MGLTRFSPAFPGVGEPGMVVVIMMVAVIIDHGHGRDHDNGGGGGHNTCGRSTLLKEIFVTLYSGCLY